jgi:hypothetical protein
MTFRRFVRVTSVLLAMCGLGLVGCSGDDDAEEDHGHDPESPSCAEIMDVCHAADEGEGPAHDCHNVAHEDVEDDCAAQKDDCIAICEAELGM